MKATGARLAKVEKAMEQERQAQEAAAVQASAAAWRAAGGPVSLVCGETEAAAQVRADALRGLGMIHEADRVHLLPLYPEFAAKLFARFCILEQWDDASRRAIAGALASPSREPPPGWRNCASTRGAVPPVHRSRAGGWSERG